LDCGLRLGLVFGVNAIRQHSLDLQALRARTARPMTG
jgi:hypothetical protein